VYSFGSIPLNRRRSLSLRWTRSFVKGIPEKPKRGRLMVEGLVQKARGEL